MNDKSKMKIIIWSLLNNVANDLVNDDDDDEDDNGGKIRAIY